MLTIYLKNMKKYGHQNIQNPFFRFLVLLLFFGSFAQNIMAQPNTLYFMDRLQKSDYLNPAQQSYCGGYLVFPPFLGLDFSMSNTGFDYDDLIRPGTGIYSDSLVIDIDHVKTKLGDHNYVISDLHLPMFGFGFWSGNSWFSFEISNKTKLNVAYPKSLVALTGGNSEYIGINNPAVIDKFGPNVLNYTEFALGWSRQMTYRLTIGARLKFISGIASIQKRNSNLKLTTTDTTYAMSLQTDLDYHISAPLEFIYDENGLISDFNYDETKIASDLSPGKNPGLGIDLGAIYKINDRLKIYASITDLGFIRWNKNATRIYQKGVFEFSGLRLDSIWSESDYNEIEALGDSLKEFFRFEHHDTKFSTSLNTNLYLGANYEIAPFLNFGFISKTYLFDKKIHQAFSLSANFKPLKSFSASLSYSYMNRDFKNIGVGMAYRLGIFQFYAVTDNIYAAFMPKNSKTAAFMAGINMSFGCNRRNNPSMMNHQTTNKKLDFL